MDFIVNTIDPVTVEEFTFELENATPSDIKLLILFGFNGNDKEVLQFTSSLSMIGSSITMDPGQVPVTANGYKRFQLQVTKECDANIGISFVPELVDIVVSDQNGNNIPNIVNSTYPLVGNITTNISQHEPLFVSMITNGYCDSYVLGGECITNATVSLTTGNSFSTLGKITINLFGNGGNFSDPLSTYAIEVEGTFSPVATGSITSSSIVINQFDLDLERDTTYLIDIRICTSLIGDNLSGSPSDEISLAVEIDPNDITYFNSCNGSGSVIHDSGGLQTYPSESFSVAPVIATIDTVQEYQGYQTVENLVGGQSQTMMILKATPSVSPSMALIFEKFVFDFTTDAQIYGAQLQRIGGSYYWGNIVGNQIIFEGFGTSQTIINSDAYFALILSVNLVGDEDLTITLNLDQSQYSAFPETVGYTSGYKSCSAINSNIINCNNVKNLTGIATNDTQYYARQEIISEQQILDYDVVYNAPTVTLNSNFEVGPNVTFETILEGCN